MANQPNRRTLVRVKERERRRAERERLDTLRRLAPFAAGGLLVVLIAVYYLVGTANSGAPKVTTATNGPHVQVDTQKIDLGDQPLGNTVHASFNVENAGDGTLTLNAAKIATVLEGC